MKNVLLISDQSQEYYYSPFIAPCVEMGVRLLLFQPALFPVSARVSVCMNDKEVTGAIEVTDLVTGRSVLCPLDSIDCAWYLRPKRPSISTALTKRERNFATIESEASLDALWSLLPCRWVNKKTTISQIESNKILQQAIAKSCGLSIPATIISNSSDDIDIFSGERGSLLLKSMSCALIDDNNGLFIYSNIFDKDEILENEAAIRNCPIFAQYYIEKKYEYRIMIIGDEVLSCQIDSQSSVKTRIDWRHYDFERVSHKSIQIPENIKLKLLEFMRRIDLHFGAIDMIETPDHEFVFLEINPSGQWDWIARLAALPIPLAVAKMLVSL